MLALVIGLVVVLLVVAGLVWWAMHEYDEEERTATWMWGGPDGPY